MVTWQLTFALSIVLIHITVMISQGHAYNNAPQLPFIMPINRQKDAIRIAFIHTLVKFLLVVALDSVFLVAIGVNIETWQLIDAKNVRLNVLHVYLNLDVKHVSQISIYLTEHV